MTDAEFLRAFDDATLDPFHHRDHLRVTFFYLLHYGEAGTRDRLGPSILRYATAKGRAEKFHRTITLSSSIVLGQSLAIPVRLCPLFKGHEMY